MGAQASGAAGPAKGPRFRQDAPPSACPISNWINDDLGHRVMPKARNRPMTGSENGESQGTAALLDALRAIAVRELNGPLAPGLYIVATPIGNLADISLRALAVLARADHLCCEDTRHSQKLLTVFGIRARLTAYHEHNAARERPKILDWLSQGAAVALISDAGTPLIADPGYKLVREAADAGHKVFPVPGASAAVAALSVSGLPTDQFLFAGFLPPKEAARRKRIEELAVIPATLVFYETAPRLAACLADLASIMPGREVVIARELTKRFEEVRRGVLPLALPVQAEEMKGEIVLLVAPAQDTGPAEDDVREAVAHAMQRMSLRDAVEEVTRTLRVPRRLVYSVALELQKV
jgi:16S rRNA (cytidine1402-2'-O)-methyltransferase